MEVSPNSDSDDSMRDFQANIEQAITGLDDIRKFRNATVARTTRRAKRKPGPKLKVVSNKWYYLPAGSPVPAFKSASGQELLLAHRREGYGYPVTHRGEGEGLAVAMEVSMTPQQFQRKVQELFPNLRGGFQCFKLDRQRNLIPLDPNHPSALCPDKSTFRYRGTVIVKDHSVNHEASIPVREQVGGEASSSLRPASIPVREQVGGEASSSLRPPAQNDSPHDTAGTPSTAQDDFIYETAGTPSVLFRRQLVEQQDQEFAESLRRDRERDGLAQAQANREQRRHQAMSRRQNDVTDEPDAGGRLRIRFPDGNSVRRRFDLSGSIQGVFNHIGTYPAATEHFSINVEGRTLDSDATGSCSMHGLRDRMSVFVQWNTAEESNDVSNESDVLLDQPSTNSTTRDLTSSTESLPAVLADTDSGRDWKTDLLLLQSEVTVGPAPLSNMINVERSRILECSKRAFNRSGFKPMAQLNIVFVDEADVGEGAVDNGGPTREFFRLLLKEAIGTHVFEGPEDARHLALSTQALADKMYMDVGRSIALSLIHGGPAPRCISAGLYQKLAGLTTQSSVADISDVTVRARLTQIQVATTMAEISEAVTSNADLLSLLGCIRHVRSLAQRDDLVQSAVDFFLFGRLQLAIDQFMAGLRTGGILELVQNHPEGVRHLFVKEDGDSLTAPMVQALFEPKLSAAGSNARRQENRIITYWRDWLIDMSVGERPVTVQQLLIFATAADEIPPLGFTDVPALEFLGDGGIFPTADVCALVLRLPFHPSYEEWIERMESGIIQSPTFGFA